jgi:hypothetical protein
MKTRSLMISLLALGTLLGGGWMYGAKKIRSSLEERIEFHQTHSGAHISYDALKIEGFPFCFNIEIQNPQIRISHGKSYPLVFQWQGEKIYLRLFPWNWRELKGHLEGTHKLTIWTQVPLAPLMDLTLKEGALLANLSHRGRLSEGTLQGEDLLVTLRSASYPIQIKRGKVTLYRGTQVTDHKRQAMWGIKLHTHYMDLPVAPSFPLSSSIQELILDAFVLKPSIPLQDWTEFLQAWREEEGALEVTRGLLSWGPLTLNLNGTLSVDQNLRPMGSMTATVSGFNEALSALAKNGVMGKKEAKIGKIALSLLATQENKQTPPSVCLPVTAQDGKLTVGPLVFSPLPSTVELIEGTR